MKAALYSPSFAKTLRLNGAERYDLANQQKLHTSPTMKTLPNVLRQVNELSITNKCLTCSFNVFFQLIEVKNEVHH